MVNLILNCLDSSKATFKISLTFQVGKFHFQSYGPGPMSFTLSICIKFASMCKMNYGTSLAGRSHFRVLPQVLLTWSVYSWTLEGIPTSTGHLGQTGLDGHWAGWQGVWALVLDLRKAIIAEQLKAKELEEATQTTLQTRTTGCPIHLQCSGYARETKVFFVCFFVFLIIN